MLTPQGTKFLARRTEKSLLTILTVNVSSSPTSKEAIKAVVATFIAERFPFRLVPSIRIGRNTVATTAGGSWHFSIEVLDIKIVLDTAALLATQGIVWLPSTWLASTASAELQETFLTKDINAKLVAELCTSLATDKQPHATDFRNLLLAPWSTPTEVDGARRQRSTRQSAEGIHQIQHAAAQDVQILALLQETKLDELKLPQANAWWKGPQIWAPANGTKGGCAILIHGNLEADVIKQEADIWGQWAWIRIRLGAETWTIMTVYVPSEPAERRSFLEEFPAIVPEADNLQLAGDFNVTLSPGLDSPDVAPRKTDAIMLASFMMEMGLTDTFRTTHPTTSGYTWFSSQRIGDRPPPKRRQNLVLAKGTPWEALTTIEKTIESMSDHRPLVASFELADQLIRGSGTFRLNMDLLNVPGVTDWITTHWRDWQRAKSGFQSEEEWLQIGFRIVTRALDTFSRMPARGHRQQEEECRRQIAEVEAESGNAPLAELYSQHRRDRWLQKLEDLQVEQQILWAKGAQEKGMITTDRMTKETFQRICPPRAHVLMRELHHPFFPEVVAAKDSEAIGEYALTYFSDILTSRRQPEQTLQQLREEIDIHNSETIARSRTTVRAAHHLRGQNWGMK
ncbi:hypothetical protein CBR_g30139 [Chara braunii]|uniref:Endonuclease/exonuclease/phosphatase domain-containing protein n=1 Tax=Chara braunii TaxID=69332 RepID=A0A388LCE5_CHABU|nr:hypothetical protein CBR_g30139 [Chara braunii]|eukprot:GBG79873.1 hypothetical protein CBR_g30139 [Chara braunii]